VRLATDTLYAALDRSTREHYVHVTNEEIVNGRACRYYELTPGGRADVGSRRTPREVWHSACGWPC
jgi:DNA-binding PadR family transcriptional regulator